MRVRTVDLVDALPVWSGLSAGWPVECSATWLSVDHGRITPDQYITLVEDRGRPAAAASWLLLTGEENRRGYAAFDLLLGSGPEAALRSTARPPTNPADGCRAALARLRAVLPPGTLAPCASVTIPSTTQPALIWDRTMPYPQQVAALTALVGGVTAAVSMSGARTIAFTNIPTSAAWSPVRLVLAAADYRPAAQAAATVLDIPPGGLPGFLARVSQRRRKTFRREMRVFAAAVDQVTVHGGERLLGEDIVNLQWQRYAKYGHRTSRSATADRLSRAHRLPGMTVLVAERRGRACAFDAFVADRALGRLVSRFNGCEPNDFFAYFNIGYYEPLRYGAAHGFTTISLGTDSYQAKVARGATIHPRDAYVRATDPALAPQIDRACTLRTIIERRRMQAELPAIAVSGHHCGP